MHGLASESDGVFLPPHLAAHVNRDARPELAILHEYFGHGLYCEYAKQAQALVAGEKTPLLEDIAESVAVWIEDKLATAIGLHDAFNAKYGSNRSPAQRMEDAYGHHVVWFSHGFPKHYDAALLDTVLTRVLGAPYERVRVALLFGSRKPYSDIDLYLVTDDPIPEFANHWLDLHVRTPAVVEQGITLLDATVTHPLLTGDVIRGDSRYINSLRKRIAATPITPAAIQLALNQAAAHRADAMQYPAESENQRLCRRSERIHTTLAHELANGRRTLTADELLLL
jgi:hypothetical protein